MSVRSSTQQRQFDGFGPPDLQDDVGLRVDICAGRDERGAGSFEVAVEDTRAEARPRLHEDDVSSALGELADCLRCRGDARLALPDLARYTDSHMEGGFLSGGKQKRPVQDSYPDPSGIKRLPLATNRSSRWLRTAQI